MKVGEDNEKVKHMNDKLQRWNKWYWINNHTQFIRVPRGRAPRAPKM